ncbi:multicomponent Na+:H+ antiporter subunit A [Devosia crocina]|uniref:Multicomponent Na+:H+ antiporter subunit A n=1 Tax=Devosia crocina TaxID=429728 RepID=A0A1I7NRH6_9HYPH|nr:hydrogen gas-evolving membrane-bound hydrogenase subunit E [Devosia crocina]SFV37297.1 multicomponent Na+:H+ antiporter subunit A [Devosia crocina]
MSLVTVLILAAAGSFLGWRLSALGGVAGRLLPVFVPAGLFVSFLFHWPVITTGGVVTDMHAWVPSLGVALNLRLDGFSYLFTLLITGIGSLVTLYAGAYFADAPGEHRARFIFLILIFMTAMLGTVLSDNLIVMFVFWEATSLTSFMLIGFDARKPEARRAALQSLLITAGGGLALFGAILLIGLELGSFSLSNAATSAGQLAQSPYLAGILVLLFLGAFTKSAQFPFHFWLPQAMAAPTPASAYLHSATMVKLGIYLLGRFDAAFAQVPAFGITLVVVGSLTMLIAAFNALRATGYKAVLAQSTVASLGILVMLIGLDGEVAAVATAGFILAHALYKAALFFCAGTAIHATHIAELRKLGGLVRFLPFTAAAAVLASFSMAGLPPFVGFISKEYLFEAQLESGWNVVPVVVAVVVNGIMVAVAGVVSLRPFFLGRDKISKVDHGETLGLLFGPLLLGILGIVMGLIPGQVTRHLVGPAATALYGAPIDTSFSLWHGITPMLFLSLAAVGLGAVLAWKWTPIHDALRAAAWTQKIDADRIYHKTVAAILGIARGSTRWLQNGDQRRYTAIVLAMLLASCLWVIWRTGSFALPEFDTILPLPALLLIAAFVGALVAAQANSLIAALIGVGIVGYGSALLFVLNGAPDLALTQFAVETLVLVVIMAVLLRLPTRTQTTRTKTEHRFDAAIAIGFAGIVFIGLAAMLAIPFDDRISLFYGETSYTEALGHNVVNVILVDYRALDTLGETAVVAFATMGAWALLRRRRTDRKG